jgi:hypothetical protein
LYSSLIDTRLRRALGGGICNAGFFAFGDSLIATGLTISDNLAIGGTGNTGAFAGAGIGGGLENDVGAVATVGGSAIDHNQAVGGQGLAGGNGSDGLGGGIANRKASSLTLSSSTVDHNKAVGGAGDVGGNGGDSFGGGIYNDGSTAFGVSSLTITGSTIAHNDADGGAAGAGGSDGQGIGGGLYLANGGMVCLDVFTQAHIKHNHASTSNDDIFGSYTTC